MTAGSAGQRPERPVRKVKQFSTPGTGPSATDPRPKISHSHPTSTHLPRLATRVGPQVLTPFKKGTKRRRFRIGSSRRQQAASERRKSLNARPLNIPARRPAHFVSDFPQCAPPILPHPTHESSRKWGHPKTHKNKNKKMPAGSVGYSRSARYGPAKRYGQFSAFQTERSVEYAYASGCHFARIYSENENLKLVCGDEGRGRFRA